ncbi:MAG: site-2 protease family protein [Methanobacteriota archaeon]|nr:MAG: site-2 protease family protein [Euryarchaeota archaeon]
MKIGRIFGIPIYLHLTFLIILPLFVWVFSSESLRIFGITLGFEGLDTTMAVEYAFGTAAAVIFFATILAHELAHSYVAIRYGVTIRSITLMLFGGVASMEEMPRKPGQELKMALAGPMTSLAIGLVSYVAMIFVRELAIGTVAAEGLEILLGIIAFYNVLLAGFNLIPAFPMDGGRMLRSFLATRMSNIDATRRAASVAKVLAAAMGVFGIVFGNIFLIFIAFFVYMGAKEEEQATVITESLEGFTVRQLMNENVQTVHPNISVQQMMDTMMATRMMGFPVVDQGLLVGIVTLTDTDKVPKERAGMTMVRDIMSRSVVTVRPNLPASDAIKLISKRNVGRLPVVDDSGALVGIVTRKDFLRMVEIMEARRKGATWGPPEWHLQHERRQHPPPPQT